MIHSSTRRRTCSPGSGGQGGVEHGRVHRDHQEVPPRRSPGPASDVSCSWCTYGFRVEMGCAGAGQGASGRWFGLGGAPARFLRSPRTASCPRPAARGTGPAAPGSGVSGWGTQRATSGRSTPAPAPAGCTHHERLRLAGRAAPASTRTMPPRSCAVDSPAAPPSSVSRYCSWTFRSGAADRHQQVVAGAEVVHGARLGQASTVAAASRVMVMPCRSVTRTAACRIWVLELGRIP